MGAVFSAQFVPRCYTQEVLETNFLAANRQSVAEAGNGSGTQKKGHIRCWKP
jgi:hypothetical protein